jgi:hypothetical protein
MCLAFFEVCSADKVKGQGYSFHRNGRDDAKRSGCAWRSSRFAVLTKLRVKDILFTAMVAMTQREADVLGVL